MTRKVFFIIFAGIMILSCQTGKPINRATDKAIMYGMIYDFDNTPVSGVTVFINNRKIADSDIQGRFILDNMSRNEYRIKLERRGYETLEETFLFDPLQVLYFKIINASQLIVMAETALETRDYSNAEKYIDRVLVMEPARPDTLFLKSVTYYLQGKNEEAITVLESLIRQGTAEPAVTGLLEILRQRIRQEE